jgi:hypothetical protein
VPAGVRVAAPVSNAAIAATLMVLLAEHEDIFPGPTLNELWTQPAHSLPPVLSELAANPFPGPRNASQDPSVPTAASGSMRSVVGGSWHLIEHEKFGDQLYDWARDPAEITDLANTPEGKSQAAILAPQGRNSPTSPKSLSGK